MEAPQVQCPKCGSQQLSAHKKGFSGKKAVVGGLLTGGLGLMAGTIGSNKIIITCLACGNEFLPGTQNNQVTSQKYTPSQKVHSKTTWQITRFITLLTSIVFILFGVLAISEKSWGGLVICIIIVLFFFIGFKNANQKIKEINEKNII